jgi:tetratricopeptide (TPR) repeat protein
VLYGRDAERALIGELLDGARASRSGTLVLRGEPGVGKTALLEDACERAADMHVLRARGVQSESELAFAAIHQLVRPALDHVDGLPSPQARALRGALGLGERTGDDRFLVSLAVLTLLADFAERRPVLCLVDDAQWLDEPSVDALLFVARRLDAEGIVMVFAAREGDVSRFEARGLSALELRGLVPKAAVSVIVRNVDGTVAPSVRDLLVEQAGGNALALVELPVALSAAQLAGAQPLPEPLPLTRDVERLFLERVRRLPESAQQLFLVVAADDTGRLAPVLRAAEILGIGTEALDVAERSGLASVRGETLELRHPLVRSAVHQGSTSSERRLVHLALADVLTHDSEADQRAWHRAAAALGPDADVADELERTAERARLRSGHAAAATALERAAELSADSDSQARRLVAAATSAWHAGLSARASRLVERASPAVSDPRLRAELNHVRGDIQHRSGGLLDAGAILMTGAAAAAPLDPRKALEMLFDAASCGMQSGDYALVVEAGQRAAALPRSGDERERFLADLLAGVGSLWLGTTVREVSLVRDVIARADDFDEPRLLAGAATGAGTIGDEVKEAALLSRAVELARASGAVDALTLALLAVAVTGVLAGRFTVAAEAAEGLRLAREAGLTGAAGLHLAVLAWFAAARGEDDECRASAGEVMQSTSATGNALAHSIAEWGLALLELSRGRPDETITRVVALGAAPLGVGHPLIVLASSPDLVEACVRTDRHEQARAAYAALEGFTRPGAPTWALALAARCRALLSQGGTAEREFAQALRLHAEANRPFDLARTQLLLGEHLRRQRQRAGARAHLRTALDTFEALGAAPWAERARSELRASGETARKRDPSTLSQLTPQELQVARFVAQGRSNKEVAAQLFLSPRTHRRAPAQRLRKARDHIADAARPPPTRRRQTGPRGQRRPVSCLSDTFNIGGFADTTRDRGA